MGNLIVTIFSIIGQTIVNTYLILLMHNKITNKNINKKSELSLFLGLIIKVIICTLLKNFIPGINTFLSILIEALLISFTLLPGR